MVISQEASTAI